MKYKVLLVEDEIFDQDIFLRYVKKARLPFECYITGSVQGAKRIMESGNFDVIITDYDLPDGTGLDVLEFVKDVPVIVATGTGNEELAVKLIKAGASDYLIKDSDQNYLKVMPMTIDNAIKLKFAEKQLSEFHEHLKELVNKRTSELKDLNIKLEEQIKFQKEKEMVINTQLEQNKNFSSNLANILGKIAAYGDPYIEFHQARVASLAREIAKGMGKPEDTQEIVYFAGLVHDIGKIYVPSEILIKPDKLTKAEMEIVQKHPVISCEMLKKIRTPQNLAGIVLQHHERIDGSGYPNNLKLKEILPEARILAVADVVEAMSSPRAWRKPFEMDYIIEELAKRSQFILDPEIIETCSALLEKKGNDIFI